MSAMHPGSKLVDSTLNMLYCDNVRMLHVNSSQRKNIKEEHENITEHMIFNFLCLIFSYYSILF